MDAGARVRRRPSLFASWVFGATLLGVVVRFTYLAVRPDRTELPVLGDGLDYHLMALHLADGKGYVAGVFETVGETAHHPPGWVTVLGLISSLGFRSMTSHQIVGLLIGVVLIVAIAALTARLFGPGTGIIAAFVSALYPGFWVLEANILSEPLALLLLAAALSCIYRFDDQPSRRTALLTGLAIGLGALARSEQLALLILVVPMSAWRHRHLRLWDRLVLNAMIVAVAAISIVPWAAYNWTRFEEPVILSTNMGPTLLAGNCATFSGDWMGSYDASCGTALSFREQPADQSVFDGMARREAIENMVENAEKLPATMLARLGRTFVVFRPTQTIDGASGWLGIDPWPVWLWSVAFWGLAPLAVYGTARTRHRGVWLLPLLIPVGVTFAIVLTFYGEPRYHAPADLSVVILASAGIADLRRRISTRGSP